MNDIVEKLLAAAAKDFAEDYTGACDLLLEAANEIKRLRAALWEVKRMVDPSRWEHINSIAKLDDAALSGKGES